MNDYSPDEVMTVAAARIGLPSTAANLARLTQAPQTVRSVSSQRGRLRPDRPRSYTSSTVIGDYERPKVRLPGCGGAPEIAAMAKEVIVIIRQSQRTFVERIDFRSSAPGSGTMLVITDLGALRLDPDDRELVLTRTHPGVSADQVRSETGWDLRVADDLAETEPPSDEELRVLRGLKSALEKSTA